MKRLVGEQVGDAVERRPPRRSAARAGRCRRRTWSRSWSSVRWKLGPLAVELVDEDHAGQAQLGGAASRSPRSAPRRRRPRSPRTRRGRPRAAPPAPRRRSRRSPGVSIRLTLWPSHSNGASASESEMLRFCSSGSVSDTVVPSSTRPDPVDGPGPQRAGPRPAWSCRLPPWPTSATLRILCASDSSSYEPPRRAELPGLPRADVGAA